jgi:hypothetical protein
LPRVGQLAEVVAHADALFRGGPSAQALLHQLPGFRLVGYHIAQASAGSADAAVRHFNQPVAEQVPAGIQSVGAEAAKGRVAGFQWGTKLD